MKWTALLVQPGYCYQAYTKTDSGLQSAASIIWFVVIPAEAAAVAEALLTE